MFHCDWSMDKYSHLMILCNPRHHLRVGVSKSLLVKEVAMALVKNELGYNLSPVRCQAPILLKDEWSLIWIKTKTQNDVKSYLLTKTQFHNYLSLRPLFARRLMNHWGKFDCPRNEQQLPIRNQIFTNNNSRCSNNNKRTFIRRVTGKSRKTFSWNYLSISSK